MFFTNVFFVFYFLPLALVLHWICVKSTNARRYSAAACLCFVALTVVFYGAHSTWWLIPFGICVVSDYWLGKALHQSKDPARRHFFLTVSILQSIGLLFVFKYWATVRSTLGFEASIFQIKNIINDVALPIGISFYTFESLSYILDLYYKRTEPARNFLEFLGFMAMFPRFLAGPIVRFIDIGKQFENYRGMRVESGLLLFSVGAFSKAVFADSWSLFVPYAFDNPSASASEAWAGVVSYAFQLYFDFAGYSLMAIGLGRCFGFKFGRNFNHPFTALSVSDFWRRWHISLTSWIQDYFYFPMAMKAALHSRFWIYLVTIATMLLFGIWHGPQFTYVYMGIWFGVALVLEQLVPLESFHKIYRRIWTLGVVAVGWVFLRAPSVSDAFQTLGSMGSLTSFVRWNSVLLEAHPLSVIFCFASLIYFFAWEARGKEITLKIAALPRWIRNSLVVGMILFSTGLNLSKVKVPFLYFEF